MRIAAEQFRSWLRQKHNDADAVTSGLCTKLGKLSCSRSLNCTAEWLASAPVPAD